MRRNGSVVVVARKGDEIIDWEDFEEAATSRQWPRTHELLSWCNQDELNIGGKSVPLRQINEQYVLRRRPLTSPRNPSRIASLPPAMLRLEFRFQTW